MIISNQSEISSLDKQIVDFLEQNRQYLEQKGRAFVNTSKEARLVQKQYKELTATNLKLKKKQKETQRQSDSVLKNLTSAKAEFGSKRGPFQEKLCSVREGLHLERQAYHSRALVGNDVHKLTKPDTINKIAKMLCP